MTTRTHPEVSNTTQKLIDLLVARDRTGRAKYGTTLDRDDLAFNDWLQHMAEELLDGAGYALAAKRTGSPTVPSETYDAALDQLWTLVGGNSHPVYRLFLSFRDAFDPSGTDEYLAYLEAAIDEAGFVVKHDGGTLGDSNFRLEPKGGAPVVDAAAGFTAADMADQGARQFAAGRASVLAERKGISAGDAVFAFASMLTTLPHVVPFGASAWATPGADLAGAFNRENGLEVSVNFPAGLVFPKMEGELLETVRQASQPAAH